MSDTYIDGICCQYRAGEFKITVNGESLAISSSGEARESYFVVGRGNGFTAEYHLDVACLGKYQHLLCPLQSKKHRIAT
jgi:hypothetical protein